LLSTLSIVKLLSRPREPLTEKGTRVLAKLKVRTLSTPGAKSAKLFTSRVSTGSPITCTSVMAELRVGLSMAAMGAVDLTEMVSAWVLMRMAKSSTVVRLTSTRTSVCSMLSNPASVASTL
jgi:hypothetical protein